MKYKIRALLEPAGILFTFAMSVRCLLHELIIAAACGPWMVGSESITELLSLRPILPWQHPQAIDNWHSHGVEAMCHLLAPTIATNGKS